jgi:hypothetical protein
MSSYSMNSTLSLEVGERERELNASLDKRKVARHGSCGHLSTTCTTIFPCLHGLLPVPLRHLTMYFLPHAAPLSHRLALTAANMLFRGNWFWLFPLHFVAKPKNEMKRKEKKRKEKKRKEKKRKEKKRKV